jgi:type IV pilus assembly protein PilC
MDKKQLHSKSFLFLYEGTDANTKTTQGSIRAASLIIAKALLKTQGITVTRLKKEKKVSLSRARITPANIAQLARQIDTMMTAGVPMMQSIDILIHGTEQHHMQQLLITIKHDLASGRPLSEALRQHPRHFDDLFCSLVAAGEASGSLEIILSRIATYKEKIETLKKKIRKALVYPIAICLVAVGVTLLLLVYVVPQFESLFSSFGADLPPFTQMVVSASRFVQRLWWLVLAAGIAVIWLLVAGKRHSPLFNRILDTVILKLPIIGPILYKAIVARFARTLSTIFAAGVPLIEALQAIAETAGNVYYTQAIYAIRDEVSQGTPLCVAMRHVDLFPIMMVQMVEIGEESGTLELMLAKVASIYEEEVDLAVDSLSSLLEPVIMVVLGVLVGGLVIAMYLPIFKMGSVV